MDCITTFELTDQDVTTMLNSTVGSFGNRKLCGRCDNYSSIAHAGLKCDKCGGDMVSVNDWLLRNLLKRVKPIPTRGENWFPFFVADYLSRKNKTSWYTAYDWACKNYQTLAELLRKNI